MALARPGELRAEIAFAEFDAAALYITDFDESGSLGVKK